MSESVIADFLAKFNADVLTTTDPVNGRVLLSQKRLVLAVRDTDTLTIPLDRIFDVAVGQVPDELDGFFDSTVTVAFQRQDSQHVATVEGDDEMISKFSTVLFKALLNGTEASVKHPARVGGRVMDTPFVPAKLFLKPRAVQFTTASEPVIITLAEVTEFRRSTRNVEGVTRPVLEVRHMPQGEAVLTMAATDSKRKLSLLGRYLRLEYSDLMAEIKDITVSKAEKEILVALYSGAGDEGLSLPQIVNKDPSNVTMMLNQLAEDELVVDTSDGTTLTPKGQVVVSKHLEDVNV